MTVRVVFATLLATAVLFIAAMRRTTTASGAPQLHRSHGAGRWAHVSPHLPAVAAGLDGFAALLRNALAVTERLQRQATAAVPLPAGAADAHAGV